MLSPEVARTVSVRVVASYSTCVTETTSTSGRMTGVSDADVVLVAVMFNGSGPGKLNRTKYIPGDTSAIFFVDPGIDTSTVCPGSVRACTLIFPEPVWNRVYVAASTCTPNTVASLPATAK